MSTTGRKQRSRERDRRLLRHRQEVEPERRDGAVPHPDADHPSRLPGKHPPPRTGGRRQTAVCGSIGHGGHDGVEHGVGRQVLAGHLEEGAGIVEELQIGHRCRLAAVRPGQPTIYPEAATHRIWPMTETMTPQHRRRRAPITCRRRTGQAGARGPRGEVVGAVEGRRHLQVRPHPAARQRLLDRHSAADRQRQPARRPRLLLHPHRPGRAVPADARQVGLLPHGLGRQRPAHRAPGPELLRRPVRPDPAVRRRLHAAREAGPEAQIPISRPNFVELCERLWRRTSRSSSSCGARSGSRSTGARPTRRSARRRRPSARRRSCATSPAARPTSRRRRPSGTSRSRPPSPRPSSRRATTPATTTGSRSTSPTGSRSTSRPPGPS